ncbi:ATP-binding protein [Simiduia agarivorans]|uniref:Sensory/regulatory protein RpfC n=1 Tax=Simiduia agarivorans (strain DSM 21679 / JCM 13881 / BCRC 17597 / SA1) TaxID=1117647 RepID=K4KMU1_SIMAS|nr:ATP-binding protein [Simiduia agarivorans]AFV00337.1 putative hybrid histidine kinase [Simiduia agarivorans SA1 = DSM 21679]
MLIILIASGLVAALLWWEGHAHQRKVSEALARDLLRVVKHELVLMGHVEILLARRWLSRQGLPESEFRADALAHIQANPSFRSLAFVDENKIVRWVEPLAGNESVQGLDNGREPSRRALLDRARRELKPWVGPPITLVQGGVGLLVVMPIEDGEQFHGWITGVLDLQAWLSTVVQPRLIAELGYSSEHSVWANDKRVTETGASGDILLASARLENGEVELAVRVGSLGGEFHLWLAPMLIFLAGLALALMVGKLQVQFRHTRQLLADTETARAALSDEVRERRTMQAMFAQGQQRAETQRNAIAALAVDQTIQSGDFAGACDQLAKVLSRVINVSRAGIWLFSDDGEAFDCISLFDAREGETSAGLRLRVADYPRYFGALKTDSRIFASDACTDPRTSEFAETYLRPLGITAMLDAGIISAGRLIGVICLEHRGGVRQWHPDEEAFASLIASLVAQLLGDQRKNRAESEARQVTNWLQHLLDAASQVSVIATDLDGVITVFNRGAENLLGYRADEMVGKQTPALIHLPIEVKERGLELSVELGQKVQGFDVFVTRARANPESHEEREWTYVRRDGGHIRVSLSVTAVRDSAGEVIGFLGVAIDISERHRARLALEAKNRALEKSNQKAQRAAERADKANKAKSAFLANMSHEIRTPMNGVLGMLNLLGRQPLSEAQAHYHELASSSARALLSIINDILDFSKIDAGKLALEVMDFDLPDLISDVVESQAQRAEEKGIGLVLDMSEVSVDFVRGDPGRLRQILTNLLSNAIKFTDQGGVTLHFALASSESGLRLSACVKDTGIGIEPEVQLRLFSAFSQADESTTRRFGGTGLGLVISKQLVELMGGTIVLDSKPGKGSAFSFTVQLELPQSDANRHRITLSGQWGVFTPWETWGRALARQLSAWGGQAEWYPSIDALATQTSAPVFDGILLDVALAQAEWHGKLAAGQRVMIVPVTYDQGLPDYCQAYVRKPVTPKALRHLFCPDSGKKTDRSAHVVRSLRGRRLLLVEDNDVNQQVVLGLLDDLGCEVTVANNGEQALAALRTAGRHIELVLMDCRMPVMDGYEATRVLRSWGGYYEQLPVVALTANALAGDKATCLAAGMNDHLAKPIHPELLEHKLQLWLNPEAPAPDSITTQRDAKVESDQSWVQSRALVTVRGKPERLVDLLQLFLRDTPERLNALTQALDGQDREQVQALAHQIKGVAGNISADQLHCLAGELEQSAGLAGWDQLHQLIEQMRQAYALASAAMQVFIDDYASGAP